MTKILTIFETVEPKPVSEGFIQAVNDFPSLVDIVEALAEFKWLLENGCKDRNYKILREFLVSVTFEQIINDLEGSYAKYK